MNRTNIEYLDYTNNPIIMRCSRVSEACENCWHVALCDMRKNNPKFPKETREIYAGKRPPKLDPVRLAQPLRKKGPAIVGTQFMGDLFHESLRLEWIAAVFGVFAFCQHLTFIVLTKRVDRMLEFFSMHNGDYGRNYQWWLNEACAALPVKDAFGIRLRPQPGGFPLPNVIGMVTAENQKRYDLRMPALIKAPFERKGISIEPCLGLIDLTPPEYRGTNLNQDVWLQELDVIIQGGEDGPRPMHPDWARQVRDRCIGRKDMGRPWPLPYYFKQWGSHVYSVPSDMESARSHLVTDYGSFYRVGKKAAGRLLDGRTWEEFPK